MRDNEERPLKPSSYIRFWGTRGSSPVSGPQYLKHGGNTSCLEVSHHQSMIIIDAGTGIRELGNLIDLKKHRLFNLLISHTHWDHITGFPFFKPLYQSECQVSVWSPIGFEKSTKELFKDMLAHSYFPVRLDEMKADVTFKDLRSDDPVSIDGLIVDSHFTNHPGLTVGFKIKTPEKTIGYITDNEVLFNYHGDPCEIDQNHPLLKPHLSLIEFLKGCDPIIHEAQYFPDEYRQKTGWGHSSISNATALIRQTGCKEWIITHHDPSHSDEDLQRKMALHEKMIEESQWDIQLKAAFDGMIIPL